MTEANPAKCSYFNSGYCKFMKKENGCRYSHPTESCKIQRCRDKGCPFRHPKICRHGQQCRYQSRCMYQHLKDVANNASGFENNNDDITINLQAEIDNLKADIVKLKTDNDEKVNTLAKIHLLELQELQKVNITIKNNLEMFHINNHNKLIEGHAHEVNDISIRNEYLKKTFSDQLSSVKNALNEKEQIIIEMKLKLDTSGDTINTLKQHIKDLGEVKCSLTNNTQLTSSTKEPPKFKCKYCGKKFSLSTVLEGHIQDYHIPMARLGATGSQPSLI